MLNIFKTIKELIKFRDYDDYIDFKSNYFSSFTIGIGILSFLGNVAWLFKDLFILKCSQDIIGYAIFFRLYSALLIPFYVVTNRRNKRLNWVLSFIIIWAGIIGTIIIDILMNPAEGFTGDGWVTFYFFFFVISLVANKQGAIYSSYGIYSVLVLLTSKEFGGPLEYRIPLIRPVSTGLILSAGMLVVSVIIRSIFTKLYTNEKVLRDISKQDILSKTWNRKKLEDLTDENYFLHRESTIFMIDIDHFKEINDAFGHLVGDDAIIKTSELLQSIIRKNDYVIRYGGDEFIVLCDGLIDEDVLYNRIINKSKLLKSQYKLSFSVGTVRCDKDNLDLHLAIKKADTALYLSKENGKGQMTKYEDVLI